MDPTASEQADTGDAERVAVYRTNDRGSAADLHVNLFKVGSILLRHRPLLMVMPTALFVLTVGLGLLADRTYTAAGSFTPQATSNSLIGLSSVAARFGVTVPTGDAMLSPEFYADLLLSRQVLRALVQSEYRFAVGGDSLTGTLIEFYDISSESEGRRRELAVDRLLGDLSIGTDPQTAVVGFSVRSRYAELSWLVAQNALRLVNQFNLESRQTQARQERAFIENRLREAEEELRSSEDALQMFLQENREFRRSPQLSFERDRLLRDVSLHQQIYTTLAQSFEKARIDEVRNTPIITVVERPIIPPKPDSRLLLIKGIVAIGIGLFLAVIIAFGVESFHRSRSVYPETTEEFLALGSETLSDFRRPWRLLRRPTSGTHAD